MCWFPAPHKLLASRIRDDPTDSISASWTESGLNLTFREYLHRHPASKEIINVIL